MGVSFTWEVVGPVEEHSFAAGNSLNKALEKCFGPFPIEFFEHDVDKLEGMVACGFEDLEELIAAIKDHGKILVRSHW